MKNKRVYSNALATYGRAIFGAFLGLVSSRWVFEALGVVDFGLYYLVGAILVFAVFLNNVMAFSASRFFALSIGKNDSEETNRWFNAAFALHVMIAVAVLTIGLPLGEYIIAHFLDIPHLRLESTIWVYRFSLLSALFSIISVPYLGMFNAKQRIGEVAILGLLQSLASFSIAILLHKFHFSNPIVVYSLGMSLSAAFIQIGQIFRGNSLYPECKLRLERILDKNKIKKILHFASWSLIGGTAGVLRDQGSAILLNMFFGPQANAPYGIAIQVSAQTNQLSSALTNAFAPEITASEGRGDDSRVRQLANKTNLFGAILILLFAIPLIIEMEYILKLWLKHPPVHTATFCRLIIITLLIDRLSTGCMLAVSAKEKIAAYQATVGGVLIMTLPVAWLVLSFGGLPTSICYSFIGTMFVASVARSFWMSSLFGMQKSDWFLQVVFPVGVIAVISSMLAIIPHVLLADSVYRILLVSFVSTIFVIGLSIFVVLTRLERLSLIERVKQRVSYLASLRPLSR